MGTLRGQVGRDGGICTEDRTQTVVAPRGRTRGQISVLLMTTTPCSRLDDTLQAEPPKGLLRDKVNNGKRPRRPHVPRCGVGSPEVRQLNRPPREEDLITHLTSSGHEWGWGV
ncbi:hypothetical protein Bbelb_128000 [Branchiostoma belcheri]|nr:hypothetical protein Bbelb_128000 [Branchiostoma belcheri]